MNLKNPLPCKGDVVCTEKSTELVCSYSKAPRCEECLCDRGSIDPRTGEIATEDVKTAYHAYREQIATVIFKACGLE